MMDILFVYTLWRILSRGMCTGKLDKKMAQGAKIPPLPRWERVGVRVKGAREEQAGRAGEWEVVFIGEWIIYYLILGNGIHIFT